MRMRTVVVLAALALVAVAGPAAATDINAFVGFDTGGSFDLGAVSVDSKTGYHLGIEVLVDLPVIEFGAGVEYGIPRGPKTGEGDLQYACVYGVGRLTLLGVLYATARYGYADVDLDAVVAKKEDSGRLWSAGLGISLVDTLKVEALYTRIEAGFTYETYSARLIYTF